MDWKTIVSSVAPWISTALGGPLGGMAVTAVANALGLSDKTEAAIKSVLAASTPEQLIAIKEADSSFALRMQELGFQNIQALEQIAASDRSSARQREMSVQDWTPRVIGHLMILGFLAMAWGVLFGEVEADTVLAGTVIGYLSAKAEQVIAYYFGSTAGGQRKSELLARSSTS